MTTTAESNRVRISYIQETTEGTTPASPAFREMRITGAPDFGQNPKSEVSAELRYDRQITDTILTNKEAGGSVNWELSYKAHDDLFTGAFASSWITTNTPEIVQTASDTPISEVAGTSHAISVSNSAAFKAGQVILLTGFGVAANNGIFTVSSITDGTPDTIVVSSGLSAEAVIPITARIKVVGFVGALGDIAAAGTHADSTVSITSTTLNFTDFLTASGADITVLDNAKSVGTWVYVKGFGATNDGWCRISSVAAKTLTFDKFPSTWETIASTGLTIYVYVGDRLRNGITKVPFTLEEKFFDLNNGSGVYQAFRGCLVNTSDFRLSAGAVVTGSFNFFARTAGISATRGTYDSDVWYSSSSDLPAYAYDVFNATSNVADIREGSTILGKETSTVFVMEVSFQMNNNLRRNTAVGVFGAANVAMGEIGISGSMNMYFSDISIVNKLLDQTESSFSIKLMDNEYGTGKGQVTLFDFPRIKYTSGNPSVSGKNTDVMVNMGFQAIRDATLGYTIMMQRFDYVDAS